MTPKALALAVVLAPTAASAQEAKGDSFVLQSCFDLNFAAYSLAEGIMVSVGKETGDERYADFDRLTGFLRVAGGPLTKAHLKDVQGTFRLLNANALACDTGKETCDRSDALVRKLLVSTFYQDCERDFLGN